MNYIYYSDIVDKILMDIVGNDFFLASEFLDIIDYVSSIFYHYDNSIAYDKLTLIVQYVMELKYQKYYCCNNSIITNNIDSDSNLCLDSFEDIDVSFDSYENDLDTIENLINHDNDYPHDIFGEKKYKTREKQILEIKNIPQFKQKSPEWFKQRNECLTATAIATALDDDPYKYPIELLFDKCGIGQPFVENENVHHGKKYEQIANMFYSSRNNIRVSEYGLIRHNKYKFIGASPDGICEKYQLTSDKLSRLVGRLLEIKCPKKRRIITRGEIDGDICPHYYYVQVQTQLFVTGMDECDFLQCQILEYDSWKEYIEDSKPNMPGISKKTNLEKGCLIQLLPRSMVSGSNKNLCIFNAVYIYPPKLHMENDEIEKWIANELMHFHENTMAQEYVVDRIIYWKLTNMLCTTIKADNEWFRSIIPLLKQFWNYVDFYKKYPKKLDKIKQLADKIGYSETSTLFKKINKDFLSIYDCNFEPLYQKKSKWRLKYDKYKKNK